jgi:hypothetical protein
MGTTPSDATSIFIADVCASGVDSAAAPSNITSVAALSEITYLH